VRMASTITASGIGVNLLSSLCVDYMRSR